MLLSIHIAVRTSVVAACALLLLLSVAPASAQERYVSAAENEAHDLVITSASGRKILISRSDRRIGDEGQVGFRDVAISRDGLAVGWTAEYANCCTSYPIPRLVEVYTAGARHAFVPAILPWSWCFVDGSATVGAVSTTAHGPQHAVLELWDVSTGALRDHFERMEDESYPDAPPWVKAVGGSGAATTHQCETK